MEKKKNKVKKKENSNASVLKKKIKYLEEELVRKDHLMEKLKQENLVLFKTVLKSSERKVDANKQDNSAKK